jgi:hypothetical protein
VPFALKAKVEQQLEKEIAQGILVPVAASEFASPIVPVLKSDGSVRICADFKRTVNLAVEPDTYPLPRIEELFAKMVGGKQFTKLDLSQAYIQLPLDTDAQELCTVNTSKGLLRYTRLPFGESPAVGIFQRRIECLLQGVESAASFIDDLIITGKDEESHLATLETVLHRLQASGLKCRLSKCDFMRDSVEYLGHRIKDMRDCRCSFTAESDSTAQLLGSHQLLRAIPAEFVIRVGPDASAAGKVKDLELEYCAAAIFRRVEEAAAGFQGAGTFQQRR